LFDFLFCNSFSVTRLYFEKDLVGSGRGLILKYDPGIRLEGMRKTMKNLSERLRSKRKDNIKMDIRIFGRQVAGLGLDDVQ
jgi:hypothetical protein